MAMYDNNANIWIWPYFVQIQIENTQTLPLFTINIKLEIICEKIFKMLYSKAWFWQIMNLQNKCVERKGLKVSWETAN